MQALCNLAKGYGPLVGRILIMKNLSILGALVFIMGAGSGPLSLKKEQEPSGT